MERLHNTGYGECFLLQHNCVHLGGMGYGGGGGIEFRVLKMTILGFFGSLEKIAPSWVPVTNIFDSVLYSIVHIEEGLN